MNTIQIKKIILSLMIVLGCFLLYFVYSNYLVKPTLITITGQGSIKTEPNIVKYTISVVNSSQEASLALTQNKNLVNDIIKVLEKNGVPSENIQTAYPQVIPPSTVLVYQAINTISVTQNDLSSFENTIIELYNLGVYSVSDIIFTAANSQALEKQAIDSAINNLEQRAKEIAKSNGKSLGRMVSLTTTEAGDAAALGGQSTTANKSLPTQIEIIRQASAIYELR